MRQALAKYEQHDMVSAERLFNQVLLSDPSNVDANFNLGAIAEDREDFSKALNYYQAALRINPADRGVADAISSVSQKGRTSV